jgi:hypothetical protein
MDGRHLPFKKGILHFRLRYRVNNIAAIDGVSLYEVYNTDFSQDIYYEITAVAACGLQQM